MQNLTLPKVVQLKQSSMLSDNLLSVTVALSLSLFLLNVNQSPWLHLTNITIYFFIIEKIF